VIADHKNKVLIGTPAKTGCTSLEFSIRYRDDVPDGLEVVHWKRGGKKPHGLLAPPGCEGYTRYLTVRHPLDRLVSLYYHLKRTPMEWRAQADVIEDLSDFKAFAVWWMTARKASGFKSHEDDGYNYSKRLPDGHDKLSWWLPPNIWMVTLGECYRFFKPHGLIRLESYEQDLADINPYWARVPHRMKAPDGAETDWRENYSAALADAVLLNHARADMKLLGYSLGRS
jgi:hypothetical protein